MVDDLSADWVLKKVKEGAETMKDWGNTEDKPYLMPQVAWRWEGDLGGVTTGPQTWCSREEAGGRNDNPPRSLLKAAMRSACRRRSAWPGWESRETLKALQIMDIRCQIRTACRRHNCEVGANSGGKIYLFYVGHKEQQFQHWKTRITKGG